MVLFWFGVVLSVPLVFALIISLLRYYFFWKTHRDLTSFEDMRDRLARKDISSHGSGDLFCRKRFERRYDKALRAVQRENKIRDRKRIR